MGTAYSYRRFVRERFLQLMADPEAFQIEFDKPWDEHDVARDWKPELQALDLDKAGLRLWKALDSDYKQQADGSFPDEASTTFGRVFHGHRVLPESYDLSGVALPRYLEPSEVKEAAEVLAKVDIEAVCSKVGFDHSICAELLDRLMQFYREAAANGEVVVASTY